MFCRSVGLAVVAATVLAGCTSTASGPDPYEEVNRRIYDANVRTDRAIIRPVSRAYGVLPGQVRTSVSNFGDNLDQPRSVINDILQGDGEDAIHNTFRFLINSTLGVGGLFDPAKDFGLEDRETGFADTMAVWGVGPGAYQMLPLIGPSTERDTFGYAVDILLNPIDAIAPDDIARLSTPAAVLEILNERVVFSSTFDDIFYESADGYEQLKIFYLDSRRFEVQEAGAEEEDAFDPYEDIYEGLYDE